MTTAAEANGYFIMVDGAPVYPDDGPLPVAATRKDADDSLTARRDRQPAGAGAGPYGLYVYDCPYCGALAYNGDPATGDRFRGSGRCVNGHGFSIVGLGLEPRGKSYDDKSGPGRLLTFADVDGYADNAPIDVWAVDGKVVRSTYGMKVDFTEGGNHAVYDWIPPNEIWVERNLPPLEQLFTAIHEYTEQYAMTALGLSYPAAHDLASRVEWAWRGRGYGPPIADLRPAWAARQLRAVGYRGVLPKGWDQDAFADPGQKRDDKYTPPIATASAGKAWDESKHPRGQPGNAGEFGPGGSGAKKPKRPIAPTKPSKAESEGRFYKAPATRGTMLPAVRQGKGKEAKIVLADGSDAPQHIQKIIGRIPPAWSDIMVAEHPDSEVQVTARDKKGAAMTVYTPEHDQRTEALKFARTDEMMRNAGIIEGQLQRDRSDPTTRENADAAWLMWEQATRPGSEADSKGLGKFYEQPISAENIIVGKPDKEGVSAVSMKFGDTEVRFKDAGTREELARRVSSGEPLMDSTYWLKSYGATTLEGRHVVPTADGVRLQFVGKESVWHDHLIKNPELGSMLLDRKAAAGDSGKIFGTNETKVRDYVAGLDGGDYLTKDLRTTRANLLGVAAVAVASPPKTWDDYKRSCRAVAEHVSGVLGNRWQQALETYINPAIFASWRAALPPQGI